MKLDLSNFAFKLAHDYKDLSLGDALVKEFAHQLLGQMLVQGIEKEQQLRRDAVEQALNMTVN